MGGLYIGYMPQMNCPTCTKAFSAKPSRVLKGWDKFCSNSCKNQGQKTGKIVKCYTCKKQIYKTLTDQNRSISKKYFCNKSCQTVWRNSLYLEEKHTNWKGGENSYRDILRRTNVVPECSKCHSADLRTLAVHHKDKDRSNNAVSNLIWLCHNCHFLVHHYKNEATGFLVPIA